MSDEYGTTIIKKNPLRTGKKQKKTIKEQLQSIGQNIRGKMADFGQDIDVQAQTPGTVNPNLGISNQGTPGPLTSKMDKSLYMFSPTGEDAPTREGFDAEDWSGFSKDDAQQIKRGSKTLAKQGDALSIADTSVARYVKPGDPMYGLDPEGKGAGAYNLGTDLMVEVPGAKESDTRYWENKLKDITVQGSSTDKESVVQSDGNKLKVSYKDVNPSKIPYITNQLRTSKVGVKSSKDKVIRISNDISRMSSKTADITVDYIPTKDGYKLEVDGDSRYIPKNLNAVELNPSTEMVQQLLVSFPERFQTEEDVVNHYKKIVTEDYILGSDKINGKVEDLLTTINKGLMTERTMNPHTKRAVYTKVKDMKYKDIASDNYAQDAVDTKVQQYVISTYQNAIKDLYGTLEDIHPEYLNYVNNPTVRQGSNVKYFVSKVQEELWNNLLVEAGMLESELRGKAVSPEYEEYYSQYKQDNAIGVKNKIRGLIVNKLAQIKKGKKQ